MINNKVKINCIIVDDEPVSREILEKYIVDCPTLHLITSCNNAVEASEVLLQHQVQLIFLDINMPLLSGISFYKSLPNPPFVIFTTAYPEYAVEGFEVDAVDYLLKPFSFERFLKSVNKLLKIVHQYHDEHSVILLKSDKKIFRIKIDDIYYLEAAGDYVKVYYLDQMIVVHDTFRHVLNRLNKSSVIQIHKSFAISLNKFEYVEGNMVKVNHQLLPIGKKYRLNLMDEINGIS